MIVAVDTSRRRLWFGWLDQAYADYPRPLAADGEIELRLRAEVVPDFGEAVSCYVSSYFQRLLDEINLLGDRVQLSRFSLHVGSLFPTEFAQRLKDFKPGGGVLMPPAGTNMGTR